MKATIIGVGNMGGAIARGLAKGKIFRAEDITCVDTNPKALEKIAQTGLPFVLSQDLRKAVSNADIVVIALKHAAVRAAVDECRDVLDFRRQIFFSVVADMSFRDLDGYVFDGHDDLRALVPNPIVFRIMPNTAISIGQSMTFITSRNANAAHLKLAEAIFGDMGRTMVIDEKLMPAAMSVASCGIAYAMRYVKASMDGAVEAGFNKAEARKMVLQVVSSAAQLLNEGGEHPEIEIERVVTPGGYTIRGLLAMEEVGFSTAVVKGIREGYSEKR